MKQEDKELLLKDLSGRFSHGVKVCLGGSDDWWILNGLFNTRYTDVMAILLPRHPSHNIYPQTHNVSLESIKPYLRPMSSMTEEEREELKQVALVDNEGVPGDIPAYIDWLNKNMFDYRWLIEKGLAIAVTEENNPYK